MLSVFSQKVTKFFPEISSREKTGCVYDALGGGGLGGEKDGV